MGHRIPSHHQDCRKSPSTDGCDCGLDALYAEVAQLRTERTTLDEEVERLRAERATIERLIATAETIIIPSTGAPFKPQVVYVHDLEAVLDGSLR